MKKKFLVLFALAVVVSANCYFRSAENGFLAILNLENVEAFAFTEQRCTSSPYDSGICEPVPFSYPATICVFPTFWVEADCDGVEDFEI